MTFCVNYSRWRRRIDMSSVCYRCSSILWTVLSLQLIGLQCVKADCNSLPATGAENNATTTRFAEGTTLEYYCNTGYDLIGRPIQRTCLGLDKWTVGPDSYSCQLKVTSIAIACAVTVVIVVIFIVLVIFAVKRLKKPQKNIDDEKKLDVADIGQDNPYFIEGGHTEDDFSLDLFDMDRTGNVSEGTTDNNNYDDENPSGGDRASTLPRPNVDLPALPPDELRYSTLPNKTSGANATPSANSSPSNKDNNHIYDSIKHAPPKLGQSMQVNDETFTRL